MKNNMKKIITEKINEYVNIIGKNGCGECKR